MLAKLVRAYVNWREKSNSKRVHFDPAFGDPKALALQDKVASGDWKAARDALRAAGKDWERRSTLLALLTEPPAVDGWLAEWVKKEPNHPDAVLTHGATLIVWAWDARTASYAEHVRADQWQSFGERLKQAKKVMDRALSVCPEDPSVWCEMMSLAIGTHEDFDTIKKYFKRAVAIDPWNAGAHSRMLQASCAKWYGSSEVMWKFARSVTSAPDCPPTFQSLLAQAHLEELFDRFRKAGSSDGEKIESEYWGDSAVRKEIMEAYKVFSTAHPQRTTNAEFYAGNHFAFALYSIGAYGKAVKEFELLDYRVTQFAPWGYFGFPASRFLRTKEVAEEKFKAATSG
ncbi:MAG: hypothetical protein AB7N71_13605 [Phycisphaerae bacterium]